MGVNELPIAALAASPPAAQPTAPAAVARATRAATTTTDGRFAAALDSAIRPGLPQPSAATAGGTEDASFGLGRALGVRRRIRDRRDVVAFGALRSVLSGSRASAEPPPQSAASSDLLPRGRPAARGNQTAGPETAGIVRLMRWTALQLRSRRGLLAALLVLLVALFAARAVVHHVAEDVAPPSATGQHEDGAHGLAVDLVAAAAGFLLLAALVARTGGVPRPAGFTFVLPRFLRSPAPLPRGRPPGAPRRVDLQSFLT